VLCRERRSLVADSSSLMSATIPLQLRVESALADERLRAALTRATEQLGSRRSSAFASLEDADAVRDAARAARMHAIAHVAQLRGKFESKLMANGAQVHWAETAADANGIVADIARRTATRRAVKSKSMVSEETHLNDALGRAGVTAVETDLG